MLSSKLSRKLFWDQFRRSMIDRSEKLMQGWKSVQKSKDDELVHFIVALLSSDNEAAVRHFETEVILGGEDAKTYLRRHMITVSYEKIELGDDIMNKPTKLMSEPNRGGYQGFDASGSGESRCFCADLDHPANAIDFMEQFRAVAMPYGK